MCCKEGSRTCKQPSISLCLYIGCSCHLFPRQSVQSDDKHLLKNIVHQILESSISGVCSESKSALLVGSHASKTLSTNSPGLAFNVNTDELVSTLSIQKRANPQLYEKPQALWGASSVSIPTMALQISMGRARSDSDLNIP